MTLLDKTGIAVAFVLLWAASAQAQFVTGDEERALRAMIPLAEFRDDPRLLIYTERTMPKTYQHSRSNVTSALWVGTNIAMSDTLEAPKGHGNGGNIRTDFPWRTTGGASRCPTVSTFKFILLPHGKPIVWFTTNLIEPVAFSGGAITEQAATVGYAWRFPVGSIVGEVLVQRHPDGSDFTFEVRTRERLKDRWTVDVFRPFPEPEDLAKAIESAAPGWQSDSQLSALVAHLRTPSPMVTRRLAAPHPRKAFDATAEVDELPPIDEALAAKLLTSTEFKSCHGINWRGSCAAPTTSARFHVVPMNYDAAFIPADDQSCKRCHETSGMHVRYFELRDWYGWMNPGDQVISFHPFDPACIATNGFCYQVRMRHIPGIIERRDPSRHTEADYSALSR